MDQIWPLFVYFRFSHHKYSTNTINDKSIDGVPGTRTRDGRMVGADESTEHCCGKFEFYITSPGYSVSEVVPLLNVSSKIIFWGAEKVRRLNILS